jgi:hypothetical protein
MVDSNRLAKADHSLYAVLGGPHMSSSLYLLPPPYTHLLRPAPRSSWRPSAPATPTGRRPIKRCPAAAPTGRPLPTTGGGRQGEQAKHPPCGVWTVKGGCACLRRSVSSLSRTRPVVGSSSPRAGRHALMNLGAGRNLLRGWVPAPRPPRPSPAPAPGNHTVLLEAVVRYH